MYPKPPGYNTLAFVNGLNGRSYKPYNGYVSGSQAYAPGAPSHQALTITFLAIPNDGTDLVVPDGPGNNPGGDLVTFTYDYGGAPGAGVIPLLAGGGNATQAAAATVAVLQAQLSNWTVTTPSAGVVKMVYNPAGFNLSSDLIEEMTVDMINTGLEGPATSTSTLLAGSSAVLPGRFGVNYCFLPAQ
jgi:hypothetical protein